MTRDNAQAVAKTVDRISHSSHTDAERAAEFALALKCMTSDDFAVVEAAVAAEKSRRENG